MKESSGMTIKEIAALLQKRIDLKLKSFNDYSEQLKAISKQIEEIEKKMYPIVLDLEPVESLVYAQNPQVQRIFESLKRIYGVSDGTDAEISDGSGS